MKPRSAPGIGMVPPGEEVRLVGRAVVGRDVEEVLARLGGLRAAVAVVDLPSFDGIVVKALAESEVVAVVNAASSSEREPGGLGVAPGPAALARAGIHLVEGVGGAVFDRLRDGDEVEVRGGALYRDGALVAKGAVPEALAREVQRRAPGRKEAVGVALESFARETVEYMRREREGLFATLDLPAGLQDEIRGRHVLLVGRGRGHGRDLAALRPYVRQVRPYVLGVNGGADAALDAGYGLDLLFGDPASFSGRAASAARRAILHVPSADGMPDAGAGAATGKNVSGVASGSALSEPPHVLVAPGTSEDVAAFLAEGCGARMVVAVGTHEGLTEFLDKEHKVPSSKFLTRLKFGPRLVDAREVARLYPKRLPLDMIVPLVAVGLVAVSVVTASSDLLADSFELLSLRLRLFLGL